MEIIAVTKKMVTEMLPVRYMNSSKGDYGKVFIVTGSRGMTGSGCLCAKAALRTGSGLVYLGVPSSVLNVYSICVPESVQVALKDDSQGFLVSEASDKVISFIDKADIFAIGPGLGLNDNIRKLVLDTVTKCEKPVIMDADALNAISADTSVFAKLKAQAVITPHPGEMSRLTGLSIPEIQNNRNNIAAEYSGKWGVIVVLKGHNTVIAAPSGEVYVNSTGNPGMATAGSGDVLTGIISSFAGQGLDLLRAAISGVYIHGLAGDTASLAKGFHGLIASDITESIPAAVLASLN